MLQSESIAKLAEALVSAQSEFRNVSKSGENAYDHYRYAKLEDYIAVASPVLTKHGLSLISSVTEQIPLEDRKTAKGGIEHAVRIRLAMRIVHVSGEWIEADAYGEGQDRADKAIYKAITGARKYGYASALGLATTDDPEADEGTSQEATAPPASRQAPKPAAKSAPPEPPLAEQAQIEFLEKWDTLVTKLGGDVARGRAFAEAKAAQYERLNPGCNAINTRVALLNKLATDKGWLPYILPVTEKQSA